MFAAMNRAKVQELHLCMVDDLKAVVALHNLKLGPALGGCRFLEYDDEQSAIEDAIRLAKGMSYKAALAKLPQGGGKSVILKPKGSFDRQKLFHQFAHFLSDLGGRYITAMDSGSLIEDMDTIREISPYVSSSSDIGDPSPSTASGVYIGIGAAALFKLDKQIKELRVAVQGLGHVGMALCQQLSDAGAKLWVADIDSNKTRLAQSLWPCTVVTPNDIAGQEVDVFAPCGLGSTINKKTVSELKCQIIAGCANNQLESDEMGDQLHDLKILYAPDYVINSGGLIFASSRYRGMDQTEIDRGVLRLKDTLNTVFSLSQTKNIPSYRIADQMAEQILYG